MKYNAEQVTYMLAEAIDQNREYKSWHCSTQHLMALVERVVAQERDALVAYAAKADIERGDLEDKLREMMAEIKRLKAEIASSRVGFTKVSPYEPGSRGRFSI